MKSINEKLHRQLDEAEQTRQRTQEEFERRLQAYRDDTAREQADWARKENDFVTEINNLKLNVKKQENEIFLQAETIARLEKEVAALKDYKESRDKLHAEIQRVKAAYEALRKEDQAHFDLLLRERTEIETTLTTRETTITELHVTIKTLETTRNELEQLVSSLNDRLEALKDVKAQLSGV